MSCGIYQILNTVTGKCYVGSSISIETMRWPDHLKRLRGNGHHAIKLQRSWNKYGSKIWKWVVLQECSEDQLPWLEAFWMARLDSVDNGYNSRKLVIDGERLIHRHSSETREKMCESQKKRFLSAEARKQRSDSQKGKKHSEERRKKNSDSQKGKKLSLETRRKMCESRKIYLETFGGIRHSEETKKKISEMRIGKKLNKPRKIKDEFKGRTWYNDGKIERPFSKNEIPLDWVKGRLKKFKSLP